MSSSVFSRRRSALLSTLCASFLLAACGGGSNNDNESGGGGGGGGGGATNDKPSATIVFPTVDAISPGSSLVVRGTASDDSAVASVTVNGVAATSNDNFATWIAEVPLAMGTNAITVSVEDDAGETTADADSINVTRVDTPMLALTGIELDMSNNEAYVFDSTMLALFRVDLATGEREVLSSPTRGSGPIISTGLNLVVDSTKAKAWVPDGREEALIEIDLATGNRAIVSSDAIGSGPSLGFVRDLAYDDGGNRIFTTHYGVSSDDWRILEVDLATGDRTEIATSTTGSGVTMYGSLFVEWDAANSRVIAFAYPSELVLIDPVTKNRNGLPLSEPNFFGYDMTLDSANDVAYISDSRHIWQVDLLTGTMTAVTGTAGSGASSELANAVAYDSVNDQLFIADLGTGVIHVALDTLERTVVSDSGDVRTGTGPEFDNVYWGAADLAGGKIYAFQDSENALVSFDMATGVRTSIGTPDHSIRRFVFDAAQQRLLSVTSEGLIEIDPSTAASTLLDDLKPEISNPFAANIALDEAGNRLFFGVAAELNEVSLDTNLASNLTNSTICTDKLRSPSRMIVDRQNDRLLVADTGPTELRAVSLTDGSCTDVLAEGANSSPRLHVVTDMVLADGGNSAYVLDTNRLMSLDLSTMTRKIIAEPNASSGAYFGGAEGLAIDEDRQLAWAIMRNSMIVIDMVSGEYVIISR